MRKLINIYATAIIILLLFTQCNDTNKKYKKTTNTVAKPIKQTVYSFDNPPKFRKDCDLFFIKKSTNQEIFKIEAEVASTREEHGRGLMFRPQMQEENGMLFIMENENMQSFYMRNTIIPLDIIYINSRFEIVDIYKNTKTLDETSLPSAAPAKYVVEINAGLCDKYNIETGDIIRY